MGSLQIVENPDFDDISGSADGLSVNIDLGMIVTV